MGARILVTGVADVHGARLAARLVRQPGVDRVVGLDTRPPGRAGRQLHDANVVGTLGLLSAAEALPDRARAVPTFLGFAPRVQVIHLDDAIAVMAVAAVRRVRGAVNVASRAPVALSHALRRMHRPALPIAGPLHGPVVGLAARAGGLSRLSEDAERHLRFGRVVDTLEALEAAAREPHRLLEAA